MRLARRRGTPPVFAEVCLHHLLLDDERYAGADAGRFLVAPPLRARDHVEALWEGLADGTIDTVGSDHCQVKSMTTGSLADAGQRYWYGIAGAGPGCRCCCPRPRPGACPWSAWCSSRRRTRRGRSAITRQGGARPRSDADIVIFDPDGGAVLPDDGFGDGTGDSVYAGLAVRGQVRDVLLRGQLVVSAGAMRTVTAAVTCRRTAAGYLLVLSRARSKKCRTLIS